MAVKAASSQPPTQKMASKQQIIKNDSPHNQQTSQQIQSISKQLEHWQRWSYLLLSAIIILISYLIVKPRLDKALQLSKHQSLPETLNTPTWSRRKRKFQAVNIVKKIQMEYGIKIVSASRGAVYDITEPNSFFMMALEFLLGNTGGRQKETFPPCSRGR